MVLYKEYQQARELLQELAGPHGFLASAIDEDNYKRVWSRDAMVCGLAALLEDDPKLIEAYKQSLLTLAKYSHENGMIPSNVDPLTDDVSFGSLVGRVDANTWFVLGACLYYLHTNDQKTWSQLVLAVEKTLAYLKAIELNDRGWIYTPLSGNWADEYPVHGYTLYDNALYLWAKRLWVRINGLPLDLAIENKTQLNFWPLDKEPEGSVYQAGPYQRALVMNAYHYGAFILPGRYDLRFDAAANAFAMLLWPLDQDRKDRMANTVENFTHQIGTPLIPAFWPIIDSKGSDWHLLKGNFSFSFKNHPGSFHNGAIWPVWMGLFAMGLSAQDMPELVDQIAKAYKAQIDACPDWDFKEFVNSKSMEFDGKSKMGYTASGLVFLRAALEGKAFIETLHL